MYCLKCRYNLRGLTAPVCPECSAPFDPADPTTWSYSPPHRSAPRLERLAIILASCPMLFIIGIHAQLLAARLILGRWPNRWGADDPLEIDGLGLLHLLNGFLLLAAFPAAAAVYALLCAMIARESWRSLWRSAACLILIWAAFTALAKVDPAEALVWWFD